MSSRYAWTVDKTWTQHEDDDTKRVPDTEFSRNGVTGPHNAPAELLTRLAAGEGRRWRTLEEGVSRETPVEQRIVHEGRYLHLDDGNELGNDAFGPLDDLSRPDVGAEDIQYRNDKGEWETL